MRWIPAALLLLVVAPTAAACHFSGPLPPGPGRFDIRAIDGARLGSVTVHDRQLGGDCGLANPYFLNGGEFGWVEGQRLSVLDMATGGVESISLPFAAWRVSADGAVLTASGEDRALVMPRPLVEAIEVPLPAGWRVFGLDGAYATLAHAPATLRLYDLANRTWAGPAVERAYFIGADRHWMAFDAPQGGIAIVHADTGLASNLTIPGAALSLDGDVVWSIVGHELLATDLPNGTTTRMASPLPAPYAPIAQGRYVVRHFSASEADEEVAAPESPSASTTVSALPTARPAPATPVLAGVALALTLFVCRRKR